MRAMTGMFALSVAAAGCGAYRNPVPVAGEIASLQGEWQGEYTGRQSGRTGSIFFRLLAGSDTAYGDVVMYPLGTSVSRPPWDATGPVDPNRPRAELLRITFVWAEQGIVSGRLDPYRDPDCGCLLTTTFRGTLTGDTLSGRFASWHEEMAHRTEGTWRAVRFRH